MIEESMKPQNQLLSITRPDVPHCPWLGVDSTLHLQTVITVHIWVQYVGTF